MLKTKDVLILGGGLAGGVCARTLLSRGYDVQVIEKESKPGGLLKAVDVAGYKLDQGPHFLFHSKEAQHVWNWANRFLEIVECQPFAWSLPNGNLDDPHDYPVSEHNALRWPDSAHILNELSRARALTASNKEQAIRTDFASQLRSLVGDTLYERYFERYTSKFWGISPSKLAGDWAPRKIRLTKKHESFFGNKLAYRPTSGFSSFVDKLYDGVPVIHDEVIGLDIAGNDAVAVRCRHRGALQARQYISTISPDRLVGRLSLAVRSLMLIYAVLDPQKDVFHSVRDVQWAYFPNDYSFTRVSDMKKCCLLRTEAPRVLCFEFPCDSRRTVDSSRFFDEARSFLYDHSCGTAADVGDWHQCWIPEAYPVPRLDHLEEFRKITTGLDRVHNLHRTGRFGAFRFNWMADIITDSLDTAGTVADSIRSLRCDA